MRILSSFFNRFLIKDIFSDNRTIYTLLSKVILGIAFVISTHAVAADSDSANNSNQIINTNQIIVSAEELKTLLQPLANSTGDFEQQLFDQQGELVQESSGTFTLKQPGRFRWDTLDPFPQNLISNGETIWLYDPDLEQVTIKSFADQQDQLPIRLISGDFSVLESGFSIVRLMGETATESTQYHLKPTDSEQIKVIELHFSKNRIQSMSVTETTGFSTVFKFRNNQAIEKLELSTFEFAVPDGTDVFYDN